MELFLQEVINDLMTSIWTQIKN